MSHPCPRCGQPTTGTYSEGGLRWAICDACMDADRERAAAERAMEQRMRRPWRDAED